MSPAAKPLLPVIVGPTASGKTDAAMIVARQLGAEIISADSRQVYKHLSIGTAKPSTDQLAAVRHHFVDILDPSEEYSAGRFGEDALKVYARCLDIGTPVCVVGGSGLYIRALVRGLFPDTPADPALRRSLQRLLDTRGEEALRSRLKDVDGESAVRIERGKPRRLIRALEVHAATGVPLSEHHRRQAVDRPFTPLLIGLSVSRQELYRRIDRRALTMIDAGLVDEARRVIAMGYAPTLNALNTVGYREAIAHVEGTLTVEAMTSLIQQNTRRFAKRQMTWFRSEENVRWVPAGEGRSPSAVADEILAIIEEPGRE